MAGSKMDRKEFMTTLARTGVGVCTCGAVLGMKAALGADTPEPERPIAAGNTAGEPPSKPGDKSTARAVKRMEFVDVWVPRFFQVVDEQLDEPTRRRLMAANGKACFCAWTPDLQRRPEPATPERIAAWVAERGPEAGYSMDGTTVVFEYVGSAETGENSPEDICLCPTVEAQSAKTISPTYCWCSVGYVKEMHERIFGRSVSVDLAHSVLMGDKRCQFRIVPA